MKLINIYHMRAFLLLTMFGLLYEAQGQQCPAMGWATYNGQSPSSVTGGGNATPVQVTTFAQLQSEVSSSGAKVIYVMNNMGNGYSGESGDRLIFASNKTVIGVKPGITIKCGTLIKNAENVIVKNLILTGPGNSNSDQAWDAVNIENSKRVWFDHCTVKDGLDGNFDVVKGADNVTATWCKFTYEKPGSHDLSNLIGSSDNETISHGKLNVTYAYCWWDNVDSRTPRTRYGKIHVLNCYYNNCGQGPHAGFMSNMRVEGCFFESNVGTPIGLTSPGGKSGCFAIDCNKGTTKTDGYSTVFTPPYMYKKYANSEVKALVTDADCGAGPTLDSPTDCGCHVITALEEKKMSEESAVIYPNPSNASFKVQLPFASDLQVFDAEGMLCEEHKNVSAKEIGANLKPGMYFLKVNARVYKLVKE